MMLSRYHLLSVALLTFVGVVIYHGGLQGPFLFDDLTNILQVDSVALRSLEVDQLLKVIHDEDGEVLRRPLARLTFALNYYFADQRFDPFVYKLTNLLIHLLTGVALYALTYQLVRHRFGAGTERWNSGYSTLFACAVAGVWLIHPIQLTSVLYAVQRMTSLAAFFVTGGLFVFAIGRARIIGGRPGGWTLIIVGIIAGTALGGLCKETAILTPLFAIVLDWFFYAPQGLTAGSRKKLHVIYGALVMMSASIAGYWILDGYGNVVSVYAVRDFEPITRLMTQARVLFFYLSLIVVPNIRRYGLFHDDLAPSVGFMTPISTAVSLLAWLLVFVIVWRGAMRQRLWAFGPVWFLLGHSIESTILGLELVHEHRNYLPSFGIVFLFAALSVTHLPRVVRHGGLRVLCIVLIALTFAWATWVRVDSWRDRLTLSQAWVRNHPTSYRSMDSLAVAYREHGGSVSLVYDTYRQAAILGHGDVLALLEMMKIVQALLLSGLDLRPDSVAGISVLKDSLDLNSDWLSQAAMGLDAEIERRLRTYRLSPASSRALFNLFVCAREGDPVCASLSSANLTWHQTAVDNHRVSEFDRTRLTLTLEALQIDAEK